MVKTFSSSANTALFYEAVRLFIFGVWDYLRLQDKPSGHFEKKSSNRRAAKGSSYGLLGSGHLKRVAKFFEQHSKTIGVLWKEYNMQGGDGVVDPDLFASSAFTINSAITADASKTAPGRSNWFIFAIDSFQCISGNFGCYVKLGDGTVICESQGIYFLSPPIFLEPGGTFPLLTINRVGYFHLPIPEIYAGQTFTRN